MTYDEFLQLFPDDDACLEYLKARFYPDRTTCPSCGRESKFHRIKARSAYSCQFCGTHVYPTAGTIFHKSRTNLRLWFWAIYLIGSTRSRISARELERELGVSYKTANRMLMQIRGVLNLAKPAGEDGDPEPAASSAEAPAPRRAAWHGRRRRS